MGISEMMVFDNYQHLEEYCQSDCARTIKVKCVRTYFGYWYKVGEIYEVYNALYNTSYGHHYMAAPFSGSGIGIDDVIVVSSDIINIAEIVNMFKEI